MTLPHQPIKAYKCRNCALIYKGFYCPKCGQSKDTKRFSLQRFFTESIRDSLELDRGIFFTLKNLTIRPGNFVLDYVKGKRTGRLNPARFLLVTGALATFISLRYQIFEVGQEDIVMHETTSSIAILSTFLEWYWGNFAQFWSAVNEYTTLVNILSIPVFSLASYFVFIRKGFNVTENIVLNTYIVCIQLLVLVVFAPFLELFPEGKNVLMFFYTVLTLAYNLWAYMRFYSMFNVKGFILSSIASILAYIGVFIAAHLTYFIIIKMGFMI